MIKRLSWADSQITEQVFTEAHELLAIFTSIIDKLKTNQI